MFSFLLSLFTLPFSSPATNLPVAAVVPYHDIVASTRLKSLKTIARLRPKTKTIILIGPDHFSVNQRQRSYSNQNWTLNKGQINFATPLLPRLSPLLSLQNGVVKNDHTVFNLLGDIKATFPQASLFPILLGQQVPLTSLNSLVSTISEVCQKDCLLLVSVDFSHYLPWALAPVHAQKTLYTLSTQIHLDVPALEVDSQQSLYVLMKFSGLKSSTNFHLLAHTNSTKLAGLRDTESTSHVMGYYSPSSANSYHPPRPFTFTFSPTLERKLNQTSLGDRFFYGVDQFNPSLNLPLTLPKNMIVAGAQTKAGTHLVFLPYKLVKGQYFLLTGDSKTKELYKFFSSLKLPFSATTDTFSGTLFYDSYPSSTTRK
jgi:poly-gamma-glutamate synthesis protein (capsule biosynthesis protein)